MNTVLVLFISYMKCHHISSLLHYKINQLNAILINQSIDKYLFIQYLYLYACYFIFICFCLFGAEIHMQFTYIHNCI